MPCLSQEARNSGGSGANKMSQATHYVRVQLDNGKVFNKSYANTSEADISFHLQDYKRDGEKYGIKVLTVFHQDNSICPEWGVA
jgi:hypothetical protein